MTFVETNVLLYAVSTAPEERAKAEIARAILDRADLALSVQVLQEFYVQATRPGRRDPLTRSQAAALIESWLRFEVQDITVALMRAPSRPPPDTGRRPGTPASSRPRG